MTNRRMYELIEHAPKTGKSPTVWAWPQLIDYLKVAGQPVQGPWPPHQEPRPDPTTSRCRSPCPTRSPPTPTPTDADAGGAPMYPSRFRYEAPRSLDEAIAPAARAAAARPRCSPAARAWCRC